jgi:hypothetical protein
MRFYDAVHLLEIRDSRDETHGKLSRNEEAKAVLLKARNRIYASVTAL